MAGQTTELKKATSEELLSAMADFYQVFDPRFAEGLRHAALVIKPGGWQYCAPAWLRKYKQSKSEIKEG